MKIFPIEKIRTLDVLTIEREPIASVDLMERAADACSRWLLARMPAAKPFVIFCGTGNNGGDGLAIARILAGKKRSVQVFILRLQDKCSADFALNLERLQKNPRISIRDLKAGELPEPPADDSIVIDALFGSGLNKPLSGFAAELVQRLNSFRVFRKIAIDIPSGLFGEDNRENDGVVFRADFTLSFQFYKLAFLFAENDPYVGEPVILPIGLHQASIDETETRAYMVGVAEVMPLLCPRARFSHKGTYGHALLMAGSRGKIGAAILASRACLRAGAGLLTTHMPSAGSIAMHAAAPEVMVSADTNEDYISELPDLSPYRAVGAGPGMGTGEEGAQVLKRLIQEANMPMVLDADALNILAENPTWLAFLRPGTILTPHPGEFDRMAGASACGTERWEKQLAFSKRFRVYVVLKGAYTCTTTPDGISWFNCSGCPGMATAGAGDVLTGILLGLLSKGHTPLESALLGVYLHGLAGEIASARRGTEAMVAGDIIESIGKAWLRLRS